MSTPDLLAHTESSSLEHGLLGLVDAWWRAANYLSVGQIYLLDNPLLKRAAGKRAHQAAPARALGHDPGLNFIYVHLNRIIKAARPQRDLHHRPGPRRAGHRRQHLSRRHLQRGLPTHRARAKRACSGCSSSSPFPAASRATVAPETPGSIHEGGELGYSLAHAFGAAFDNPDLLVACVVGDGEAETGALATSWHSNKFLDPVRDGAVLPILHLNGYKIAGPTVLARIPQDELEALLRGYGYAPSSSKATSRCRCISAWPRPSTCVVAEIAAIQRRARARRARRRGRAGR